LKQNFFFAETKVFTRKNTKILGLAFALNKKTPYICVTLRKSNDLKGKLADGVTGNTSDFGSEESRFEPWSANRQSPKLKNQLWTFFMSKLSISIFLNRYYKAGICW
jgi:hypothetical protein